MDGGSFVRDTSLEGGGALSREAGEGRGGGGEACATEARHAQRNCRRQPRPGMKFPGYKGSVG
jgi:hypothetical protein